MPAGPAQFSLAERLAHALLVRSPWSGVIATIDVVGQALAPAWWRRNSFWYAGRLHRVPVARLDGVSVELPGTSLDPVQLGAVALGHYEVAERHAIGRFLDPTLTLVELGGSIGALACVANRLLADPTRHVVVEANPALIQLLSANRTRNRARFHIVHAALAYDDDAVAFSRQASHVAGALATNDDVDAVRVPSTTLAGVLDRSRVIGHLTLLCDIEGAEVELVERESQLLAERCQTFIVEVHPGRRGQEAVNGIAVRLRDVGFELVSSRGDVWVLRNPRLVANRPTSG